MHDPVVYREAQAPEPRVDSPVLRRLYRLFSDVCQWCPTLRQARWLAEAEAIWGVVYAWREGPVPESEVRCALIRALGAARDLERDYRTVGLVWDGKPEGGVWRLARGGEPVRLAKGLSRGVLLKFTVPAQEAGWASVGVGCGAWNGSVVDVVPEETVVVPVMLLATRVGQTSVDIRLGPGERLREARFRVRIPVLVEEPAVVRGLLRDNRVVAPGRVRVVGSDGQIRHGDAYSGNPTVSEKPVVFRPASMKLPFFYSDGRFAVSVPAGDVEIRLDRGCEHTPAVWRGRVSPGGSRRVELDSRRFVDMAARGWVSADTHVHWVKNSWDTNESLGLLRVVQRAEDIRVVNNLTLYQWRPAEQGGAFVKPDHHAPGPVPGMCGAGWHVQMGEELRNDNHYGHVVLLGHRDRTEPLASGAGSGGPPGTPDQPHNRRAVERVRKAGGVAIEAHDIGPFHASDVPANVALGRADSLDQIDPRHYYRFLDCGFRIGLTNGSDHPARVLGIVRAYVRVEGRFDYRRWLEGVRAGRTFTTSGPLLGLRVGGASIGETVERDGPGPVEVTAWAWSRERLGTVELVTNGGRVLRREVCDGCRLDWKFRIAVERGSWFCLRVSADGVHWNVLDGPGIAHSSAVWVRVGGRDTISAEAAQFWIGNLAIHRERLERFGVFPDPAVRREALEHVDAGRRVYERLIAAATGVSPSPMGSLGRNALD